MKPISRIDPSTNQLYFRGINATELGKNSNFESVLYLLVNGSLPSPEQYMKTTKRIIQLRGHYSKDMYSLLDLAKNIDYLQIEHKLDLYDSLLTFVSLTPLVVANQIATREDMKKEGPNIEQNLVSNFLWMVRGIVPMESDVNDFQNALILHMDDPDNPSLSALRRTLDDGKSVSEALVAALNEHVKPLHHGAGTKAMTMFEEIEKPTNVRDYLSERLETGEKIFGLGHRIYRGTDPRAIVLREMLERRTLNTCDAWLLEVIDAVIKEGHSLLKESKGIDAYPNVDLFNAAVYFSFGIPPEFNTALFAVSRATGWMAHILERNSEQ